MTYTSKYITCVLGWLKTWKLECSNESSGQHTASEGASHARQATGLADTAGAGRWVSSESVPTENPRRFHYWEQGNLQQQLPMLNIVCITAVLVHQYRHCRRPPWAKRKMRDYDHSTTRTPTKTLIGMVRGDQCLDVVAFERSRLIRPTWFLCLRRL